jgi:SAM-dependent methyltransferase
MGHSVERHLVVEPNAYDVQIRRFVPAYDQLLDQVGEALEESLPDRPGRSCRVIDLGAGTGALSARIAARFPEVSLILLDADPEMLLEAEKRLHGVRERIELRRGLFGEQLPEVDAAVASLALHHVHERSAKVATYANIRRALVPGGVLVSSDATVPASPRAKEVLMRRWAAHLIANGDSEEQAYARFAQWALEDRYYGIEEELDMLREAGFREVDVRFRTGPMSVLVARKE